MYFLNEDSLKHEIPRQRQIQFLKRCFLLIIYVIVTSSSQFIIFINFGSSFNPEFNQLGVELLVAFGCVSHRSTYLYFQISDDEIILSAIDLKFFLPQRSHNANYIAKRLMWIVLLVT